MRCNDQININMFPGDIIVDSRESKTVRIRNMSRIVTCTYGVLTLFTGDYWFVGDKEEVLIERKTLTDLESSFFVRHEGGGNRLDSEVARMLHWKNGRQAISKRTIRVRLAIEGSYIPDIISSRLLTYQAMGLEVIWGTDMPRMLAWQHKYNMKGKHKPLLVRPGTVDISGMPLKERILLPLLNTKQRKAILENYMHMEDFCRAVDSAPETISKLPGFGPKTIDKLIEGLIWVKE